VHSYALGELLGVPGCGPIVDQGHRKFWDFAGAHLIDHVRGGWYPELDPDNHRKVGPWYGKPDLYHALQACLLPLLPPSPSLAGALRSAPPAL
jgi:mannose/cellobiose epimerase-like protein (N-acyl-D-glucosamine 2-epimerase family)